MNPLLLVRPDFMTKYELKFAEAHFPIVARRTACRNCLVIGRYSVLPFYREIEADLAVNGCKLINSHAQHCRIANFEYYKQLKDVTPEVRPPDGIEMVMAGDNAAVAVSLDKPVAFDIGSHFAVREGGKTVGSGVITEVVE